ncbi:hypothetical protein C0J52_05562 [Blattella germanica]|nr:hypothetical protein C0J52_05562 [Blattella germanica]
MKHSYPILFLILASAVFTFCIELECTDSKDCGDHHCCILSMMPYSFPGCAEMSGEGGWCKPGQMSDSTSVTYPNGESFNLTNIYYNFCGVCLPGLKCDPQTMSCKAP